MSKSKGVIWLADASRHSTLVVHHRGVSGADHKFIWSEPHQAHIYEGRELDQDEFNKVALEIFASRDHTYFRPVGRLLEPVGSGGEQAELLAKWQKLADEGGEVITRQRADIAERDAKIAELTESLLTAEKQSIDFQAAAEMLKVQVGILPAGAHPDEAKPRGATWLEERANWQAEVERLRAEVTRLTTRPEPIAVPASESAPSPAAGAAPDAARPEEPKRRKRSAAKSE